MTITSPKTIKKLILTIIVIFSTALLNAEILMDDVFGYFMDLPEGFQMQDSDGDSYLFYHPNFPVNLAVKIYSESKSADSQKVMENAISKLPSVQTNDCVISLTWNEKKSTIAEFTMQLDKTYYSYAACFPTEVENHYLFVMCYTPQDQLELTQQFCVSTINSFYRAEKYKNEPGILSTFAFQNTKTINVKRTFKGKTFEYTLGNEDLDANIFITELEYAILYLYREHSLGIEAWKRFYRRIYQDSYNRLASFCQAFYKTYYPMAMQENPSNPQIAYAQIVLDFVQEMQYKRADEKTDTDFTSMIEILYGVGNDCDSRSMLVSILLNHAGIETILLVSPTYSHAMAAVLNNAPGQKYTLKENGKQYLYGETTADVTWGMVAQDFSDESKWIPVIFE